MFFYSLDVRNGTHNFLDITKFIKGGGGKGELFICSEILFYLSVLKKKLDKKKRGPILMASRFMLKTVVYKQYTTSKKYDICTGRLRDISQCSIIYSSMMNLKSVEL